MEFSSKNFNRVVCSKFIELVGAYRTLANPESSPANKPTTDFLSGFVVNFLIDKEVLLGEFIQNK